MSKVTSLFVIATGAFMHKGNVVTPGSKVELTPSDAYNLLGRGKVQLVEGQEVTDPHGGGDNDGPTREEVIAHLRTLNKGPLVQFAKDNDIEIDESKNKDIILEAVIAAVEKFDDEE